MIRALVDFALKSRWLVLGGVAVLTRVGIISFKALPIEAYPDVANNYVQIITQWPAFGGRDRAPGHRSGRNPDGRHPAPHPSPLHPLAGLSSLMLIFDDDSHSESSRARAGAAQPGQTAANLFPRWAPTGAGGPDLLVHPGSTNPSYDVME